MAVDAMEIDSNPTVTELPERKRKHKTQDPSSKKKRKNESGEKKEKKSSSKDKTKTNKSSKPTAPKQPDSPYTLTTATLYLPLSPISISPTHALASLLAEHLSPLLLTYYPPLKGIVLAYSNASISSTPPTVASTSGSGSQDFNPQPLTLATSANEYGVLYVYLTATFLVFRPQKGQILEGWVNVQSEGFLGAVVLNLFSVGIERKRLPTDWKWVPPGEEADNSPETNGVKTDEDSDTSEKPSFNSEKEHFQPVSLASDANPLSEINQDQTTGTENDDDAAAEGYFQSVSGHRVRGTVRFRVLDIDVIPGTDRERGFLSIEGTMLSPEEEERVTEDEKNGILSTATPRRPTPVQMSGALPSSAGKGEAQEEAEEVEPAETPSKPKTKKTDDKEKKKSKSKKKDKEKE